jgi:CubicO group peptidase (beta-lactamase class C family)
MTTLLPRSRPEDQGVPSGALARLVQALDEIDHVHTLTVVRHGHVVAETSWAPYGRDLPHALYSVSKSFTAMAVGLAVSEGRFGLDDRVIDLLPDDAPAVITDRLASLRVRHLLTMSTGHAEEPRDWGEDWSATLLAAELTFDPGTHWLYNTPATYALSEIVQRRTGLRLRDYLGPRLFEPLGFEEPWWEQSPTGVDAGGFGLMLRSEEIAAFGQLLLQRGRWGGRTLVPAEWIDLATSAQIFNGTGEGDWNRGYGFQFWRCRHDAYRADGAFGQYVVVMPDHDAVIAMTGGLSDMQLPLEAIWRELMPAWDTEEPPAAVPTRLAIAAPGGAVRDEVVEFRYEGPIGRVRIERDTLTLDGAELTVVPGRWTPAHLGSGHGRRGFWYGDRFVVAGGWVADAYVAQLRALQDAVTFRLEVSSTGRLTITRDHGFTGPDVWAGDPMGVQPDVADHHSAVSP